MIEDLQSLIDAYLGDGKHRNLQTLASKANVSYSTVRRVAQGEVKSIDLSNALAILQVATDWNTTLNYLRSHFPEAGRYYDTVATKRSVTETSDQSVDVCLRDFAKFVVLALVTTPEGATMERIVGVVGNRAAPIVEEMIAADMLLVKNSKVVPSQLQLGVLDLSTQLAMTQHCLLFVSDENRSKRRQHAGVFTEGVSAEGQSAIHAVLERALDEIHGIAAKNPGNTPIFYGALMGSFLSEADHA